MKPGDVCYKGAEVGDGVRCMVRRAGRCYKVKIANFIHYDESTSEPETSEESSEDSETESDSDEGWRTSSLLFP